MEFDTYKLSIGAGGDLKITAGYRETSCCARSAFGQRHGKDGDDDDDDAAAVNSIGCDSSAILRLLCIE